MAQWYVKDLSRLTGISVQTLHHYDRIGLLTPSTRLANSYRSYSEKDLCKLQQIVALKFFGFSLADIKTLQQENADIMSHLVAQSQLLQAKARTLLAASQTINSVISDCKNDTSLSLKKILMLIEVYKMAPKLYFECDSAQQKAYETYLIHSSKCTSAHIEKTHEITKNWKNEDWDAFKQENDMLNKKLASAMLRKCTPDEAEVQSLIRQHYAMVQKFWTPDKASYTGLASLYLEHEDFRTFYDAYSPQLTDFLAKAMKIFAQRIL